MRRQQRGFAHRAAAGYRSAYNSAREFPGTIAAVVVGIGVTAFLLWAARRAGGWDNLQADARERLQHGYDYARDGYGRAREAIGERVSRFKESREDLLER